MSIKWEVKDVIEKVNMALGMTQPQEKLGLKDRVKEAANKMFGGKK